MSVITVIKKVGERIISIVEWPFQHSVQVAKIIETGIEDELELKAALVGLVEQFEALGPDTTAAIAANGFNLPADMKEATDLKSLFSFFENTLKPAVEKTLTDVKGDLGAAATGSTAPAAADPAQASTDPAAVQAGPGLHTVTAA
jgi:hypothetical protein